MKYLRDLNAKELTVLSTFIVKSDPDYINSRFTVGLNPNEFPCVMKYPPNTSTPLAGV